MNVMVQKKRIIFIYFSLYVFIFTTYAVIRFMEFSAVKELDVSQYLTNDNICYELEGTVDSKNMFLSGYAYWFGDVERGLHFAVALKDTQTGEVFEVPTIIQERDDKEEKYSPISHFGFVARMNKEKLDLAHRKYQICFVDKMSGGGVLAHTDEYMGGE